MGGGVGVVLWWCCVQAGPWAGGFRVGCCRLCVGRPNPSFLYPPNRRPGGCGFLHLTSPPPLAPPLLPPCAHTVAVQKQSTQWRGGTRQGQWAAGATGSGTGARSFGGGGGGREKKQLRRPPCSLPAPPLHSPVPAPLPPPLRRKTGKGDGGQRGRATVT